MPLRDDVVWENTGLRAVNRNLEYAIFETKS